MQIGSDVKSHAGRMATGRDNRVSDSPGPAHLPAHRRAEDRHDLPAGCAVGQPGPAGRPGAPACRVTATATIRGRAGTCVKPPGPLPTRPIHGPASGTSWPARRCVPGSGRSSPTNCWRRPARSRPSVPCGSLLRAEVHVIVTVRNFAALLPAEWQEAVKCRGTDRMGSVARRGDRRGGGGLPAPPVVVLEGPRHPGHSGHVVAAHPAGTGACRHRAAPGFREPAVDAVRGGHGHRAGWVRRGRGAAEFLPRICGDRVLAPDERGPAG